MSSTRIALLPGNGASGVNSLRSRVTGAWPGLNGRVARAVPATAHIWHAVRKFETGQAGRPILPRVSGYPAGIALPQCLYAARAGVAWAQDVAGNAVPIATFTTMTDTLALLKDMNAGVLAWVSCQSRDAEGTQSPVRALGFGARIVSGYLHNPLQPAGGSANAGTMHAWAEVYVPGAGWITFDPTNRSVGGANLIPVAVGRDIRQVMPVAGGFVGMSDAFSGMSVEVSVGAWQAQGQCARHASLPRAAAAEFSWLVVT